MKLAFGPKDLALSANEVEWRDRWIQRIDKYLRDHSFGDAIEIPAVAVSEHLDSVPSLRLANSVCKEYMKDGKWSSVTYAEEFFHFKP
jgi:hypothetical protein